MRRPRSQTAIAAIALAALGAHATSMAAACGSGDPSSPANPIVQGPSDGAAVIDSAAPVGTDAEAGGIDAAPVPAPFGLDTRPSNKSCVAPARPIAAGSSVTFEPVYAAISPFDVPMMMTQLPGDSSHWLVALRNGKILRFDSNNPQTKTIVADVPALAGLLLGYGGEGGFLGFAPHPKFAQPTAKEKGRVYVTWNSADTTPGNYLRSRIGYITSLDGGATFTSYTNVLFFEQAYASHYGGGIAFGPRDGFLYASFGDGADAVHGQNTATFFSKVLRIDVDNVPAASTYGIPADNPFALSGGEPATFAYGFRNPFRFSFDRVTGDLWVGDVGEAGFEEVDKVERGGNYGWRCREGMHNITFTPDPLYCPNGLGNTIDPIVEHEHVNGVSTSRSITGGVVYRGKAIPSFVGTYVYGDYVTGELFALTFDPITGKPITSVITGAPTGHWVQFAEDNDGEVYAVDLYGSLYRMIAAPAPPVDGGAATSFPARLSETGCVVASDPKKPASGLVPYDVNAPFWSDGADKERFLAVPDTKTIAVGADGDFDIPNGSVLMKTFSLGGKRIETRLFMRHDDGVWAGYSYAWLDDESDAVLLPSSSKKRVGPPATAQDWYFPSRAECMRCHTEQAGRSLGLELGQLNGDFVYTSTNRISNQLATLEHIGLFTTALPSPPSQLPRIPKVFGAADPVEARARAYLHSNCSMCHRPPGVGRAAIDLRFSTDLAGTKTCNIAPSAGDLGIASAKIITPANPTLSLLSVRPHALGASRMPPLASSVVDNAGLAVVDTWITGLAAVCP